MRTYVCVCVIKNKIDSDLSLADDFNLVPLSVGQSWDDLVAIQITPIQRQRYGPTAVVNVQHRQPAQQLQGDEVFRLILRQLRHGPVVKQQPVSLYQVREK